MPGPRSPDAAYGTKPREFRLYRTPDPVGWPDPIRMSTCRPVSLRTGPDCPECRRQGDVYWLRVPRDSVLEVPVRGDIPSVKPAPTTVTGPLGSTVHVLRADAGTVAALAAVDWNRRFRRVCVDPARGLITLMSPSRLHEELATIFGDIVDVAAEILSGAGRGIGSTRLRRSGDPPDTGMEPDCAFYVGDRARAYSAALHEGEAAADQFLDQVPPDLVVEVEITNADEGKAERYADVGVREMWRLRARKGSREFETEFLALNPGEPPRPLDALCGSRRTGAHRRSGGDGRSPARCHQERTHRGRRPGRASATATHRARPRGGAALPRRTEPARDGRTGRVLLKRKVFVVRAAVRVFPHGERSRSSPPDRVWW